MAGKTKKYSEPERGQKWVAGVEANLEKATGKTLAEWVKIAKTCPEEKPMPRLRWFKQEHGLSVARAAVVIGKAFGEDAFGRNDPETLVKNLFSSKTFEPQRAIYDAVEKYVQKLSGAILSPRKGYVALYRLKQFGAIKPSKDGLLVGLAMKKYPKSSRFVDVTNLGGGDRTKKAVLLASVKAFDGEAKDLIKAAWTES